MLRDAGGDPVPDGSQDEIPKEGWAVARYERVAEIYELLASSREPLSLDSLCGSLGASTATVKRLIRFLRDELGTAVTFDREQNGYRLDRDGRTRGVIGPAYDSRELSALLGAYEILEQIPPGLFRRETTALRARLQQLLYKRPTGHGEVRDRVRLVMPQSRQVNEEQFHMVLSSLSMQRRLRVGYHSRSRDTVTERLVSPQRLTFYRSNWYLAAWCHRSGDLRVFSLDRIARAELTPLPSTVVATEVLEIRLTSAYGIFEGEATEVAKLQFTADTARWVADEEWHPKQRLDRLTDGSVILFVPYRHSTELKMDILRYGPEVEVLSPPALRDEVAQSLEAAASRYRQAQATA